MPDVWLRYIRVAEAIARRRSPRPDRSASDHLGRSPAYAVVGGQAGRNRQATAASIDRRTLETRTARVAISDTRVVAAPNLTCWYGMSCPVPDGGPSPEPPATAAKTETIKRFERLTTKLSPTSLPAKE